MKYFPYEEIFRKNHYTGVKGEDSAQAARVAVAASAVVGVEGIAGRVEVFLLLILLVALLVVFHPLAIALVGLRLVAKRSQLSVLSQFFLMFTDLG